MKHTDHYDVLCILCIDDIEDAIGEALGERPPYSPVYCLAHRWVWLDIRKHGIHLSKEVGSESRDSRLVPLIGLGEVTFGFGPYE